MKQAQGSYSDTNQRLVI